MPRRLSLSVRPSWEWVAPLLQAALDSAEALDRWITQFALELRTATFLSGASRSRDLGTCPSVVTGATREWIDQLGYRAPTRQVRSNARS